MLGILCEKPSAAKNFAKALGGSTGTFDGEQYCIVNAFGHMYEFEDPVDMARPGVRSKYEGSWALDKLPWNETDFTWKRKQKPNVSSGLSTIRSTLSKCSMIAIATDLDSSGEGDLLAWEILAELGLTSKPVCRFDFVDESPKSIQQAFRARRMLPPMEQCPEYRKAYFRTQWDLLSMQFTRIASCLTGSTLRQGRLKSAMVVIVGDGLKAVKAYKKIPYYQWRFKDENGNVFVSKNEPSFPDKSQLAQKYGPSAVVVDKTEQKNKQPPKMLDLAALSALLAPKGYTAKQVLDCYQKMYESNICSYPRSEDKEITPEQYKDMLPVANEIARVVGIDPSILTHRTPRPVHVKTGGSHGANRPGLTVPNSLADLNKFGACAADIYTILAKSYLAILCEDYIYTHQEGHLVQYPDFKGSANAPVSQGYKAVYAGLGDDDDDDGGALLGSNASPFVYEGFPPKPPTPTMKWLMKQLEKHDVGTGATRTSTYAEVTNASSKTALMKDARGKITLTEAGQMSYLILPGTHIGSLELTEQVYQEMRDVAAGKANPDALLHSIQQMVLDDIQTMTANMTHVKAEFPDAGGSGAVKEKVSGIYQPSGQQVEFSKSFSGHEFTPSETAALLAGQTVSFEAVSKTGKPYTATGRLAEQTYKGKKFWGFALEDRPADPDKVEGVYAPKKKKIRFKRVFGGHRFTDQEVADLLAGKSISYQAVSKSGAPYTATGKLKEQTYNGTKYWGFAFDK